MGNLLSEEREGDSGVQAHVQAARLHAAATSLLRATVPSPTLGDDVIRVELTGDVARLALPMEDAATSPDPRTRALAGQAARQLTHALVEAARQKQEVEGTIATLMREMQLGKDIRRRRILSRLGWIAFLLVIMRGAILHNYWLWWLIPGGSWAALGGSSTARREAVARLAQSWDGRAVGALAIAYRDGDRELKGLALNALLSLLPRVKPSDANYLTQDSMRALVALSGVHDQRVHLALLGALTQVGDETAIPAVVWLWDDPQNLDSVRQAAADCLGALMQRTAQTRASQSLLRASGVPADPASTLLRSGGVGYVPPDELLRPQSDQLPG